MINVKLDMNKDMKGRRDESSREKQLIHIQSAFVLVPYSPPRIHNKSLKILIVQYISC